MLDKFVNATKTRTAALSMALFSAFNTVDLMAAPPEPSKVDLSQSSRLILDVVDTASDYSKRSGGVGIIISYGYHPKIPPAEAIGEKFVSLVERNNGSANYFIVPGNVPGVSIAFTMQDEGTDFMSVNAAAAYVPTAVSVNEVAKNVEEALRK